MAPILLPAALLAATLASAQPQPTETKPAETPEELALQIKKVTAYLVEAQEWKRHAASGKAGEIRKERVADAAASYRAQRRLLQELITRLQIWTDFADEIDHDKPTLTDKEVQVERQRTVDAISELRDVTRAAPASRR